MPDDALIQLQAGLGPGQLERLAAFGSRGGPLLIAPPAGADRLDALAFTVAVAAALRVLRGRDPETAPPLEP